MRNPGPISYKWPHVSLRSTAGYDLKKPLIVLHEQISDVVRHGKTVTASRREPRQAPRFMVTAGVDFGPNHLERDQQRLDGIIAGALSFGLSFRPSDLEPANPADLSLFRSMNADRNINVGLVAQNE